jgi:hypothetical protein
LDEGRPAEFTATSCGLFSSAAPFDSGPLDDGETTLAADRLFSDLEAEENEAGPL